MYHDAYDVYELLDKWNHRGPPDAVGVQDLFQRESSAARQEFLYGQTLLHKCMEFYSNKLDLVVTLVESYPEAVTKTDDNGFLPLHRALTSGSGSPSKLLVQYLVEQAPETLFETTAMGALPLHLACNRPRSMEIVQYLVDLFPDAVQFRDINGKFPLDIALEAVDPQENVIELLIQHYPMLLSFLDDDGSLPLHKTLRRRVHRYDKIVDLLVDHGPGALRIQDLRQGQTPLLLACQNNNSLSQVYSLIRKWPEQVASPTYTPTMIFSSPRVTGGTESDEEESVSHCFNGELLPSALTSKSITMDHLRVWVQRYDHVLTTVDGQGRLPLHYAVLSSSDDALDMVNFLLDEADERKSNTDGPSTPNTQTGGSDIGAATLCRVADNEGRLPLHYAAAKPNNHAIVQVLLEKFSNGLVQPDSSGRLPWHYAEVARQDMVYECTNEYFPNVSTDDLDLVPDEIRWDVLQVASRDT